MCNVVVLWLLIELIDSLSQSPLKVPNVIHVPWTHLLRIQTTPWLNQSFSHSSQQRVPILCSVRG